MFKQWFNKVFFLFLLLFDEDIPRYSKVEITREDKCTYLQLDLELSQHEEKKILAVTLHSLS